MSPWCVWFLHAPVPSQIVGKEAEDSFIKIKLVAFYFLPLVSRLNNKISLKYKDEKRFGVKRSLNKEGKKRKLNFQGDKISRYLVSFLFWLFKENKSHI